MSDFSVLEPAVDPNNRISFLLDWELTMKCNLDCSYCLVGIDKSHDNSTKHPPLDQCLTAIDFMFEYVDLYMDIKPKGIKYVILNVYGGEALHHPHVAEILSAIPKKYEPYKEKWHLTVTTTTNAIVSDKKLQSIIPYIDEFSCSYHTECTPKQKEQFKKNLLAIRDSGKRLKCIVLMHPETDLFDDAQAMINWCVDHGIKYLPKQLDHGTHREEFFLDTKQIKWFKSTFKKMSYGTDTEINLKHVEDKADLSDSGRGCCGGRQTCKDQNYKQRDYFVPNKFTDWYCSVNEFFVFVKQLTGDIYTNKDCKMSFNGKIEPIGHLSNYKELVSFTKASLADKSMPAIQCKKYRCLCGICAPKAKDKAVFHNIMEKYHTK